MFGRIALLLIVMFALSAFAQEEDGALAARRAKLQSILDHEPFSFDERYTGPLYSLTQCDATCDVHIIYKPSERWEMLFKFMRDGQEIVVAPGHAHSSFQVSDKVLYFAHFSPHSSGCTVTAHVLEDGKTLWVTKLRGVPVAGHSLYANRVMLSVQPDYVVVSSRESFGDHTEILDRKTGASLAQRIYRSGLARQPTRPTSQPTR